VCVSSSVDVATTSGGPRFGATSGCTAFGGLLVTVPASGGGPGADARRFEPADLDVRRIAALAPLTFDQFYRAEYPRVVALAQSLTGSRQVAEELAQEGFIAAHGRWRTIGAYDRPGDWVRRVVTNRAISVFRRKAAEKRALARVGPDATVAAAVPEQDAWLWQQVRALPPRQAQAIALAYVEDLPLERVAAILGCAETTVKTHLARGRQALARAIELRDAEAAPAPVTENVAEKAVVAGAPVAAPRSRAVRRSEVRR
jgi:RNA polymerase sigma factor (sigma-70 family)